MDVKRIAIIGYGARGKIYHSVAVKFPEMFETVAAVDIDEKRRREAKRDGIEYIYEDYKDLLEAGHPLDMVIVSSMDASHKEQAIACIQKGYHLLLEKPIATTLGDCLEILKNAEEYKRNVYVCHVLRYTPFYRTLKDIVDSGTAGEIINIHASENIGFFHFAHSYVRGNWRNGQESGPIILTKCCHDMDIIRYLIGEKCISVSSVGNLSYFNEAHAPAGSAAYCSDCAFGRKCPYYAPRVYTTYGKGFSTYFSGWSFDDKTILKDLKGSFYDRCVFRCDNNVADHQSTVMSFEHGRTAVHTFSAFSKDIYRDIKIYGTKAEIVGIMEKNLIQIRPFGGRVKNVKVMLPTDCVGGHCGGDHFMMQQIYKALNNQPCKGITSLNVSTESHEMAFAAEKSRLNGGTLEYLS